MNTKLTKILTLCLLLALLAGMALPGHAAAKPSIVKSTLWAGVGRSALIVLNLPEGAKSFSVSSSDKSIIKAGCDDRNDASTLWIKPLKVGKAKITVKYKAAGKTKSVSATFTVKKYTCPFTWFKINGKKLDLKANKLGYDCAGYSKNSITVDYKLASGWTVKARTVSKLVEGYGYRDSSWKKNKAISLKGVEAGIVSIVLKNKAGNEFTYMVFIIR